MDTFAVNESSDDEKDLTSGGGLVYDINELGEIQEDTSQTNDVNPQITIKNDQASKGSEENQSGSSNSIQEKENQIGSSNSVLDEREEEHDSVVKIVTTHCEDLDINSEYMYNHWETKNGRDNYGKGDDGNESETRKQDTSLDDELENLTDSHKAEEEKLETSSSKQEDKTESDSQVRATVCSDKEAEVENHVINHKVIEPRTEFNITSSINNEEQTSKKKGDASLESSNEEENRTSPSQASGRSTSPDKVDRKSKKYVDNLIKSANDDVREQKYKKAVRKYEEALGMATELGDVFLTQSCACNLGAVLVIQGQAARAINILKDQLRNDNWNDNVDFQMDRKYVSAIADIHYNLGLAYDTNGETDSAIKSFQAASKHFKKWNNVKGQADSHNQIAELFSKQGNLEKARSSYGKAAKYYDQDGNVLMKARMLVKEARMLNVEADRDSFLDVMGTCEEASLAVLKNNRSNGNSPKEAKLFHDMAVLCRKEGNNAEALRWLEESWKRCYQSGGKKPSRDDLRLRAAVSQSLARMYLHSCEMMSAVQIYKEAISLHGALGNQSERGWCFYYLGEAYRRLCDYPSAERYYHVAHQTLSEAGDHDHLWKVTEGLADINVARNHLDVAAMYYREALAIRAPLHSRTKSASDKIVIKLTNVLEDQKAKHYDIVAARQKRVPVVVGYDPGTNDSTTLIDGDGNGCSTEEVFKPPYGSQPVTSTPHSAATHGKPISRLRSVRKYKGKRKGSGAGLLPVTKGVAEYHSESDLSLAQNLQEAYYATYNHVSKGEKSHLQIQQSRYLTRRSVTPSGSSSDDDDDKAEDDSNSDSGCKNVWEKAKEMISRLGSGLDSSTTEEDEGIQSKESDRFDHTYEHPRAMYATVNKREPFPEEPIYESLRGTTLMLSSMPTRQPPPPVPPIESHPSLYKKKMSDINRPSTSKEDFDDETDDDSFTSVSDDELSDMKHTVSPDERKFFPTTNTMSRGGLEAGLYEIQKLEDEKKQLRLSYQEETDATPSRRFTAKDKDSSSSSRVCAVM